MDGIREIYTVQEGNFTLREYVISATNKHRFEVKNRAKVVYEGESYQQAKSLFQKLTEKITPPLENDPEVVAIRPRRRARAAYAANA